MAISENIVVGSQTWVGHPEQVWIDGEVLKINGEEVEVQTSSGNKLDGGMTFRVPLTFLVVWFLWLELCELLYPNSDEDLAIFMGIALSSTLIVGLPNVVVMGAVLHLTSHGSRGVFSDAHQWYQSWFINSLTKGYLHKVVSSLSKLHPKDADAPAGGVEDMTNLAYLHEPAVLHNLATRYKMNEIYTYTGNILIAVNPFQSLLHLYHTDVMQRYKGAMLGDLSPHVFAIADAAYKAMVNEEKSNAILVSGESGAGKTETTKMIMRYLAFLGGHAAAEGNSVEQQVLESNPVLEAFGNAKTVRNNNSSRFGKFVEIQFNKYGKISGTAIRTYLLEKSRVCQISDPERNYHCFYLLCAAPPEEKERYKLGDLKSFHYLNQSSCYELDGVNAAQEYLSTKKAMDVVGITLEEQDAIFRVVAAILHLGNIKFEKSEEDSSVLADEESKFHLEMTAELLKCVPSALEDALCKRLMITPEEVIMRSLDPLAATTSRDGLAKTLYSRLFDWLVQKINVSIGQDPGSKCNIGVLDIYGFESFEANSFEQFCINYTNEKLQQHFNQHVFKIEQEEYKREAIDWSYLEFVDNQDILDLIEKKPGGIIALLDEACMFPRSTHETFSQKLYQTFKNNKRFIKPKLSKSDFTIVHYAGEVQYQSDQFLDKNKDYVVPEHQDMLSSSKCFFVASLFPPLSEETAKSAKFASIGARFKLQLQQLMETLKSTEPYYIRCVKPNDELKPGVFDNKNVIQQLRSGGVFEAVRIKCAGFPTHRTFRDFLARVALLAPEIVKENSDEKDSCIKILEKIGLTGYQIGESQIFLRAGQMAELDARRALLLSGSAIVIQKQIKTHLAQKRYVSLKNSSVCVQSFCRGVMARKSYYYMKRNAAATRIQRNVRGKLARKKYNQICIYAIVLQTGFRAMAAHDELRYRMETSAAIKYQVVEKAVEIDSQIVEKAVVNESPYVEESIGRCKDTESIYAIKKPSSHPQDSEKIGALTSEVINLKVMLQAEKQRADDYERKYEEAQESREELRKKLAETEKRVYQLQDSWNRMISSMSSQVADLTLTLSTSSRLSSTFRPNARVDVASSNSDTSSTDSDFTAPAPASNTTNQSNSQPCSIQLVFHGLTAVDGSGSEGEKEGPFDDCF